MNAAADPRMGAVASALRGIDAELERLDELERAAARERVLLVAARDALLGEAAGRHTRRRRVAREEITAYLVEHPGSWPAEIAEALDAPSTNVSTHLYRGRDTRYERREDGWYVRSHPSATVGLSDSRRV